MHAGVAHNVTAHEFMPTVDADVVLVTIIGALVLLRPARVLVLLAVLGRVRFPVFRRLAFLDRLVLLARVMLFGRRHDRRVDDLSAHGEVALVLQIDENADILGLAAANAAAAVSGTFVVNGSPTQTAMADSAGARSQVAQLVFAGIVLLVLLFLTGPLQYLPRCVLASIVFTIAVGMVDVKGLRAILHESPGEFYLAVFTAAAVVVIGVEQGILMAIALSLVRHVRHSYRPHSMVLAPNATGRWAPAPATPGSETEPGLIVYRFGADLFYANVNRFADEVRCLVQRAPTPVSWFIVDAGAITDIDYSAAQSIRDLLDELHRQDVRMVFARVSSYLRSDMDRHGITAAIGEGPPVPGPTGQRRHGQVLWRQLPCVEEGMCQVRGLPPGVRAYKRHAIQKRKRSYWRSVSTRRGSRRCRPAIAAWPRGPNIPGSRLSGAGPSRRVGSSTGGRVGGSGSGRKRSASASRTRPARAGSIGGRGTRRRRSSTTSSTRSIGSGLSMTNQRSAPAVARSRCTRSGADRRYAHC